MSGRASGTSSEVLFARLREEGSYIGRSVAARACLPLFLSSSFTLLTLLPNIMLPLLLSSPRTRVPVRPCARTYQPSETSRLYCLINIITDRVCPAAGSRAGTADRNPYSNAP